MENQKSHGIFGGLYYLYLFIMHYYGGVDYFIKIHIMDETELLELKKEITEASGKAAELKGQHTLLTTQLKEKWNVTTPKQGEAKLKSMQVRIDEKDEEIKNKTEELEKQLQDENSEI